MDIYIQIKKAFDFYNQELFNNELPDCIITLSRTTDTIGYFSPKRFVNNSERTVKHELCLNPNYFGVLPLEKELATIVHEMTHLYMEINGFKSSVGYHNKKWASIMLSFGLIPTDTGFEGGKTTGYAITQLIDNNGPFYKATQKLLNSGFSFPWADSFYNNEQKEVPQIIEVKSYTGGKRVKYSCGCSNVWGKTGLEIVCSKCGKAFMVDEKGNMSETMFETEKEK